MSSITFDATLNDAKLQQGINESRKSVKEWVKEVESGGEKINKGFDKMGVSAKDAVKIQKELVKELQADVKKLEKTLQEAVPGTSSQKMLNKLSATKAYLIQEQEQLMNMQREQIEVNSREEESQNRIIGTMGKWAMGFLTVGAAMKGFKAVMESTERTSLVFHSTINGLKTALDYFLKAIANADFSNFINGIKESFRAGKEFTKTQDEIQNVSREYSIKQAELNKRIEEQRRILYEDDKTSITEKRKAGDEMLRLIKERSDMEIDIAVRTYDAVATLEKNKNKMSEADLRFAIENYSKVETIGKQAAQYIVYLDAWEQKRKSSFLAPSIAADKGIGVAKMNAYGNWSGEPGEVWLSEDNAKKWRSELAALGEDAEKIGRIYQAFGSVTEKERDLITGAIVGIKEAENEYNIASKRIYRIKENLEDQEVKKAEEKEQAIREIQGRIEALKVDGMDRELEVLKQKYDEDLIAFKDNAEAKKLLTEQYFLEEIEIRLKYLKKQQDEETKFAEKLQKIDPGKGYAILGRAVKSPVTGASNLRGTNQDQAKIEKQVNENLEKQLALRLEILNVASGLLYRIGETIGLQDRELSQLGNMLDAFTQFASGNIAGAIGSLVSTVIESFPSAAEKYNNEIERLNKLLEQQTRLIEESERKGGQQTELEKKVDILLKKEETTVKALAKAQEKLDKSRGGLFFAGRQNRVKELKEELIDVQNELADANQALTDFLGGGITQITIAETIAEGFREGKTSVDDFAEYTNRILIDAVMSAFQAEILGPEITALQEYISQALADKALTTDEKAKIDERIKLIADANKQLWEDLTGSLDLEEVGTSGLAGGIQRQLTEDTGSELAGLFRRFADDNRAIKDYTKVGVNHLVGIEQNTYNTVEELKLAVTELRAINTNTKPVYSGEL